MRLTQIDRYGTMASRFPGRARYVPLPARGKAWARNRNDFDDCDRDSSPVHVLLATCVHVRFSLAVGRRFFSFCRSPDASISARCCNVPRGKGCSDVHGISFVSLYGYVASVRLCAVNSAPVRDYGDSARRRSRVNGPWCDELVCHALSTLRCIYSAPSFPVERPCPAVGD